MMARIVENNSNLTVDDVVRLWRSVGWSWYENDDGYERTVRALNDERHTTFLAYVEEELVGLAHCMDNGLVAYLCYIAVDPQHQGSGVGTELLKAFDERYFDYHRHMMADNGTVGFYRANGYGHDGEYTAMAKWACETSAPKTATGDWSRSAYSLYKKQNG